MCQFGLIHNFMTCVLVIITGAAFIQQVETLDGFLLISGCTFKKNSATGDEGGAAYIQNLDVNFTLSKNVFEENTANGRGGVCCF